MARVANIGLVERRKRHRAGVVAILLGAAVAIAARMLELHPAALAASAALLFVGFLGVFQARAHTCVALVSRGVRDMDDGPRAIGDPSEAEALRAQARTVVAKSVLAALVVTGLAIALL